MKNQFILPFFSNINFRNPKPLEYSQYVDKYLSFVNLYQNGNDPETIGIVSLRHLKLQLYRNSAIIYLILIIFGVICFPLFHKDFNSIISIIYIGLILIGLTYLYLDKYLPKYEFYHRIENRVRDFLKLEPCAQIRQDILREYLLIEKRDRPLLLARALYEETKESWLKDKELNKTNTERILIFYYVLNRKLKFTRSQPELVYLLSCLIGVGESVSAGEKAEILSILNRLYEKDKFSKTEISKLKNIEPKLHRVKSILVEIIELIDRDKSKIESL